MTGKIAGIDVHKRVLMVAVEGETGEGEKEGFGLRRFGTTVAELEHLRAWLQTQGGRRDRNGVDGAILEAGMVHPGGAVPAIPGASLE